MNNENFKEKFAAVLPAGGLGKRMGGVIPKQLMLLKNKPVYQYSLETFLQMQEIAEVVIAVPKDWKSHFEKEIFDEFSENSLCKRSPHLKNIITKKIKIVIGGKERFESVQNGINALKSHAEYVLVHDVARPFISKEIIHEVCKTLVNKGSCLVAKPAIDTIKIAHEGKIESTIDRTKVWLAQTPQGARIDLLKKLYEKLNQEQFPFTPTDEASILEYFNEPVYIVKGSIINDKITTPEDFSFFTKLIES